MHTNKVYYYFYDFEDYDYYCDDNYDDYYDRCICHLYYDHAYCICNACFLIIMIMVMIMVMPVCCVQLVCSAPRAAERGLHLALRQPAGPGLPGHGRPRHHLQQRRGSVEEDARLLRQRSAHVLVSAVRTMLSQAKLIESMNEKAWMDAGQECRRWI